MASQEYWKDKRIDRRQVLFAWGLVIVLAAGAHYAELVYTAVTCDRGADYAATSDYRGQMATARYQSLR
jgi:hypothetical protein